MSTGKKKNTILLYKDAAHIAMWKSLKGDDVKELLLALLEYQPGEDIANTKFTNPSIMGYYAMETIKINENEARYQEVAAKKKEAANARWNKPNLEPNKAFDEETPAEPAKAPESAQNCPTTGVMEQSPSEPVKAPQIAQKCQPQWKKDVLIYPSSVDRYWVALNTGDTKTQYEIETSFCRNDEEIQEMREYVNAKYSKKSTILAI